METPSGMREMQTLRKLPMTMPKRKKKKGITVSTVPQAGRRLNAACGGACRMANGKLDGVRGKAVGKKRKTHRRDAEGRRGPRRTAEDRGELWESRSVLGEARGSLNLVYGDEQV